MRITEYGAAINKLSISKADFLDNIRNICGHSYYLAECENGKKKCFVDCMSYRKWSEE
jgi:hypothetical protein